MVYSRNKQQQDKNPIFKLAKARAARLGDIQEDRVLKRQATIALLLKEGGKPFVRSLANAKTDKGEPIVLNPWFEEYAELIADIRVTDICTSGCAQVGKSVAHNLLLAFLCIDCSLNVMFAFPLERSLLRVVSAMQRPILNSWAKNAGVSPKKKEAVQNNSNWGANGGQVFFTYTSTSSTNSSGAAAGNAVVSVSVDFVMADEVSQHSPGAIDVVSRRMDAGRLPTYPIRRIGTPGSGGAGAELEIERSDYHFYPHVVCDRCEAIVPLHPEGTLLRPTEKFLPNGDKIISYVSDAGRPVKWFHRDPSSPMTSACFACPHCGKAIADETRIHKSFFQCLKTGVKLRDFLDAIDVIPENRLKVGITLSPLLREKKGLAAELIRNGLETGNTADWMQQALGLPSTSGGAALTEQQIRYSVLAPKRDRKHHFTVVGIDQGRGADYVTIVAVSKPDNKKLSTEQIFEQSTREILFAGAVERCNIPELLSTYRVDYGLIDNEPSLESAADLCSVTCLEMCDQQAKQQDSYKLAMVRDGGREFQAIKTRYSKFMREVQLNYTMMMEDGYPRIKSPDEWQKWFGLPTEQSPIVHLTSVSFDAEEGKWVRSPSHADHLYYAQHFAETAIYVYLHEHDYHNNWFEYV